MSKKCVCEKMTCRNVYVTRGIDYLQTVKDLRRQPSVVKVTMKTISSSSYHLRTKSQNQLILTDALSELFLRLPN